jgi:hypothetical protein
MSNPGMGIGDATKGGPCFSGRENGSNPSSLKLRRTGRGGAEVAEGSGRGKDEGNNEKDETSEI